MKYDEQFTIDQFRNYMKSEPVGLLYRTKFVNWKGTTKDTDKYYTEVLAQELLQNLSVLSSINTISRTSSYRINHHDKIEIDLQSNRDEEIFAKRIACLNLEYLGKILDYQIPLKDTQESKAGKIDMVSYEATDRRFHLIELKYFGNEETLLRTILEIYTYSMIVDGAKLLNDYSDDFPVQSHTGNIDIVPVILMPDSEECNPYNELMDMYSDKRPKLKALALALGIEFFTIDVGTTKWDL